MNRLLIIKQLQILLITLIILGFTLPLPMANKVAANSSKTIYVKQNATGDGTSWDNALGDLHTALTQAQTGDQVWIAAGTYVPTGNQIGSDMKTRHFQMKNGVSIYGGFPEDASNETGMIDRDWQTNKTILSGQFGSDHLYHVFFHEKLNLDETAKLDGVTITGGFAKGTTEIHRNGAGMYNGKSSPSLINVVITGNQANYAGGGMYNSNSNIRLANVTIDDNYAKYEGGGLYNIDSHLILTNATISNNFTESVGGGIFNGAGKLEIIGGIITGNSSFKGGGMFSEDSNETTLIDVTMSGNRAFLEGGAMNHIYSKFAMINVTVSGNWSEMGSSYGGGGGVYVHGSQMSINNSVIWGNASKNNIGNEFYFFNNLGWGTFEIHNSIIGESGGSGSLWFQNNGISESQNIDINPLFRSPIPASNEPTSEGDYRLSVNSPAINAGQNTLYPGDGKNAYDLDSRMRTVNERIDMGAYEFQPELSIKTIRHLTNEDVDIQVQAMQIGTGDVVTKWVKGKYDLETFPINSGTTFNGQFTVKENGWYSIFVEDMQGYKTIYLVDVQAIVREKPAITLKIIYPNDFASEYVEITEKLGHVELGNFIAERKVASGIQDEAYFETEGTKIIGNTFPFGPETIFTVYVRDKAGNVAVKNVSIKGMNPAVDIPLPVITAHTGVAFSTLMYDPTQKYVGEFTTISSNGIMGNLTGIRVNEDGVADSSGRFTKLQGTLNGTSNGKLVEVKLAANGPSIYVRLVTTPATNGQYDIVPLKP